jgi:hypothetical protein
MAETKYIAAGTLAHFGLAEPDETPLTFRLTLPAREWRKLMSELPTDGCSQTLGHMISTMLDELTGKMRATYATTGWSGANPVQDP